MFTHLSIAALGKAERRNRKRNSGAAKPAPNPHEARVFSRNWYNTALRTFQRLIPSANAAGTLSRKISSSAGMLFVKYDFQSAGPFVAASIVLVLCQPLSVAALPALG